MTGVVAPPPAGSVNNRSETAAPLSATRTTAEPCTSTGSIVSTTQPPVLSTRIGYVHPATPGKMRSKGLWVWPNTNVNSRPPAGVAPGWSRSGSSAWS